MRLVTPLTVIAACTLLHSLAGALEAASVPQLIRQIRQRKETRSALVELAKLGPRAIPARQAVIELLAGGHGRPFIEESLRVLLVTGVEEKDLSIVAKRLGGTRGRSGEAILRRAHKAALPHIIERLNQPDSAYAHQACFRLLAQLGPDAKPALPTLMDIGRKKVANGSHHRAIWTIGYLREGAKPALPMLRELIRANGREQKSAAQAVARMGPHGAAAVPDIIAALETEQPASAYELLKALEAIGPDAAAAVPVLRRLVQSDDNGQVRGFALQTLVPLGPAAVEALPDLLGFVDSPRLDHCRPAMQAIGAMGPKAADAVPQLTAALDRQGFSSGVDRRTYIVQALANIGPAANPSVPSILKITTFDGAGQKLRRSVVEVLPRFADQPNVAETLTGLLDDSDFRLRNASIEALGQMGPKGRPALKALNDRLRQAMKDRRVIDAALLAGALARISNDRNAISTLRLLSATGKTPESRLRAAVHLIELNPNDPKPALTMRAVIEKIDQRQWTQRRSDLAVDLKQIVSMSMPARETLTRMLADRRPETRIVACKAIAVAGSAAQDMLPTLIKMMWEDRDPDVRKAADEAVNWIRYDIGWTKGLT